jgi:tripartite-type tricarboxylate transporter receptor subunit TctC
MRKLIVTAALIGPLAGIAGAAAQDWPTRPVTMVIPFAAGTGTDVLGRIFAERLTEFLGRQVIIENVPGAGSMIGASRVAKATPDGYQFVFGTSGAFAYNQTLYKKPLYNAAMDFAPVALVAEAPFVLLASKHLPASNLQEFIAYAKENHAKMQYGSPGVGSSNHLSCELLNSAIGINVTHIPYRTGLPISSQDLIAGRIDYMCLSAAAALSLLGYTKPIAILTKNRSLSIPELPSAHEQGLTNFDVDVWFAIFLPKNTPGPIIQKLHDATLAAMNTRSLQERAKQIGVDLVAPERRSPEYLQKFVENEIEKWAAVIRAAGVTAQ